MRHARPRRQALRGKKTPLTGLPPRDHQGESSEKSYASPATRPPSLATEDDTDQQGDGRKRDRPRTRTQPGERGGPRAPRSREQRRRRQQQVKRDDLANTVGCCCCEGIDVGLLLRRRVYARGRLEDRGVYRADARMTGARNPRRAPPRSRIASPCDRDQGTEWARRGADEGAR